MRVDKIMLKRVQYVKFTLKNCKNKDSNTVL